MNYLDLIAEFKKKEEGKSNLALAILLNLKKISNDEMTISSVSKSMKVLENILSDTEKLCTLILDDNDRSS